MAGVADGLADDGRLRVGRHGHVEDLDRLVGEQVGDGGVAAGNAVLLGDGAGAGRVARGDGHGVEAGLAVGDEVAVAHDEAGADAADAEVLAPRQTRQVVEGEVHEGHQLPAGRGSGRSREQRGGVVSPWADFDGSCQRLPRRR